MSLTIAIPGLIWPDSGDIDYLYSELKTPYLNKFIAKTKVKYLDYSYSDFLCNLDTDHVNKNDFTLAMQMATHLNIQHEFKHFLFAEPTHLRVDRDRLLISEAELLQLDHTESIEIINKINNHFAPDFKLYYLDEHLWLLGLNIYPGTEKFSPIIDIIGENIDDYLPKEKNSILYNKFLNEVQMLLFSLSVNKNRQTEGSLTSNSIWLWDKSTRQLDTEYTQIYANNNLSLLKHDKILPLPNNLNEIFKSNQNTLVIIDQLYYPSCYRDSYSWQDKIKNLDEKIFAVMANLKINNFRLLIPMQNKTLELTNKSIFGIFQKKNLNSLAKEWHEK